MKDLEYDDVQEGDKISFTFYSNIDPYPKCEGIVKHVYGPSLVWGAALRKQYFYLDVEVTATDSWKQDMVGQVYRIRNDYDITVLK